MALLNQSPETFDLTRQNVRNVNGRPVVAFKSTRFLSDYNEASVDVNWRPTFYNKTGMYPEDMRPDQFENLSYRLTPGLRSKYLELKSTKKLNTTLAPALHPVSRPSTGGPSPVVNGSGSGSKLTSQAGVGGSIIGVYKQYPAAAYGLTAVGIGAAIYQMTRKKKKN